MPNLDPIRRALDAADPIPPWLVRGLVEQLEKAEANAASFQRIATHATARRLVDTVGYEMLLEAAVAWRDAIQRCDDIHAAEQALIAAIGECLLEESTEPP